MATGTATAKRQIQVNDERKFARLTFQVRWLNATLQTTPRLPHTVIRDPRSIASLHKQVRKQQKLDNTGERVFLAEYRIGVRVAQRINVVPQLHPSAAHLYNACGNIGQKPHPQ